MRRKKLKKPAFDPTLPEKLVASYGAGVDSTAMLVGYHARGIRPDLIVFADTGAEKPATYLFLWKINEWLAKVGFPGVTVVRYVPPKAPYKDMEGEFAKNETLPSLALGYHSCSLKWKVKPIDAFVAKWAKRAPVLTAIGYDAGAADAKRLKKACTFKPSPGKRYTYPLTEWGWDRARCEAEIAAAGIMVPGKSACFFCPASKPAEIAALKRDHPGLYDRALAIEARAIAGKHKIGARSVKGLGRRFAWKDLELDAIELDEAA